MDSPRLRGVHEHLDRAQFLFDAAMNSEDAKASYRLMLAAIYSCRAVTELMLEAAEMQEVSSLNNRAVKLGRKELEAQLSPKLPFYALIERIRIHDFHRLGLVPPDPEKRELMFGGPIKLRAIGGGVALAIASEGPRIVVSGASQVQPQRPLLTQDGKFYDEESSAYVPLSVVIGEFLARAGNVVAEFATYVALPAIEPA